MICLILASADLRAQWDEEGAVIVSKNGYVRFISVGGAMSFHTQLDESVTGIRYEGLGMGVSLSHIKENDRLYSEWDLQSRFSRQKYHGDILLPASLKNTRLSFDYRALAFLNPDTERKKTKVFLGGLFAGVYDHSLYPHLAESGMVQSYAISLGGSIMFRKELDVYDHTAFLSLDFSFPMLSIVSRTDYLNRRESLDTEFQTLSSFIDRSRAGLWGRYLRLNTRIMYNYVLENGNRVGLSYQWDFARIRRDHNLYTGIHQLGFHVQFNY